MLLFTGRPRGHVCRASPWAFALVLCRGPEGYHFDCGCVLRCARQGQPATGAPLKQLPTCTSWNFCSWSVHGHRPFGSFLRNCHDIGQVQPSGGDIGRNWGDGFCFFFHMLPDFCGSKSQVIPSISGWFIPFFIDWKHLCRCWRNGTSAKWMEAEGRALFWLTARGALPWITPLQKLWVRVPTPGDTVRDWGFKNGAGLEKWNTVETNLEESSAWTSSKNNKNTIDIKDWNLFQVCGLTWAQKRSAWSYFVGIG